ncbi:MAG: hypothetical protein E6G44_00260 [Actinobacteria bacterium]|nr:MAG: hypothetical protein E6G44_00260 [Actinomycetota bacterium]
MYTSSPYAAVQGWSQFVHSGPFTLTAVNVAPWSVDLATATSVLMPLIPYARKLTYTVPVAGSTVTTQSTCRGYLTPLTRFDTTWPGPNDLPPSLDTRM